MNLLLLKQLSILSAFAGAILGFITIIPYVSFISFMLLILCLSAFVLAYLKQNELIGIISVREGCIFGAVIGFVSFLAFAVVFKYASWMAYSFLYTRLYEIFSRQFRFIYCNDFSDNIYGWYKCLV